MTADQKIAELAKIVKDLTLELIGNTDDDSEIERLGGIVSRASELAGERDTQGTITRPWIPPG